MVSSLRFLPLLIYIIILRLPPFVLGVPSPTRHRERLPSAPTRALFHWRNFLSLPRLRQQSHPSSIKLAVDPLLRLVQIPSSLNHASIMSQSPASSQLKLTESTKDETETEQNSTISSPSPSNHTDSQQPHVITPQFNVTSTPALSLEAHSNETTIFSQSNNTTLQSSPDGNNRTQTNQKTDHLSDENEDDSLTKRTTVGSIQGFFDEARSQRERILNGGFIEVIEWLFVFLLVAPGTFPAIGCVLYGCTNLARRHFGSSVLNNSNNNIDATNSRNDLHASQQQHHHHHHHSPNSSHRSRQQHWSSQSVTMQRNPLLDNGPSLTARTR